MKDDDNDLSPEERRTLQEMAWALNRMPQTVNEWQQRANWTLSLCVTRRDRLQRLKDVNAPKFFINKEIRMVHQARQRLSRLLRRLGELP